MNMKKFCGKCPNKRQLWYSSPDNYGETILLGRMDKNEHCIRWCAKIDDNESSMAYNRLLVHHERVSDFIDEFDYMVTPTKECFFYPEVLIAQINKENDNA